MTAVTKKQAENAVRTLLRWVGEDPTRDGLADTPDRFVRYLKEATAGYAQDPQSILSKSFASHADDPESYYNGMVVQKDIPWYSLCEHHLVTIEGVAHIGYIPNPKTHRVVGLSKLARVVDCFARRLSIQEKMTHQIADAITKAIDPAGVAVVLEATHHCMTSRGVQKPGTKCRTAVFTLAFLNHDATRNEFMFHLANTQG